MIRDKIEADRDTLNSPYLLPNPSVVSFSGGRTSGYMLRKILDAFGGVLPDWVKVVFCNTGKELEPTYEFIERISQRWDVPITWLEFRWHPGRKSFVEVDFSSASRKGEPFELLIKSRSMLPNKAMRFCTIDLKLRPSNRFMRQTCGFDKYTNAIGFRHDEPKRVAKLGTEGVAAAVYAKLFEEWPDEDDAGNPLPGETPVCPLNEARVDKPMILDWWKRQDFDLELEDGEGNCDLCFLKGAGNLLKAMKKRPESAEWWIERERERELSEKVQVLRKRKMALFDSSRPTYSELLEIAQEKQNGPGWLWADNANGSCGELDECRCTD